MMNKNPLNAQHYICAISSDVLQCYKVLIGAFYLNVQPSNIKNLSCDKSVVPNESITSFIGRNDFKSFRKVRQ